MDLKLDGKIALVTGSTAGIGFAIARSLARQGALVYLNGRTQARVDAAVTAIRSESDTVKVDGIVADFSERSGAEAVIREVPAVDVLVNNVGIFEPKPFLQIPDDEFGWMGVSAHRGLAQPSSEWTPGRAHCNQRQAG
jgi:NAD(P)-dependent dehydrogenase (short-subunit alcohol dehydrogenase family)